MSVIEHAADDGLILTSHAPYQYTELMKVSLNEKITKG